MIPHSRPSLGEEEKRACAEVIDSLQIAQGAKVAEFERNFSEQVNRRYAVAVSSGTSALTLALLALEISQGDEVILPSYTCVALLHALEAVGGHPVLADIDSEDFNISVSEVKKKIGRKTKAIIVPHLFGRAARIGELIGFNPRVIEDGTQALGAHVGGKKVGMFGDISLFSFYATKMITTGEGGILLTDSKRLADKLFDLRDYDKKNIYHFRTNSKMTDLEAAMGIEQLKKLPFFIQRRRQIAGRYLESLDSSTAVAPREDSDRGHVFYRFVIRVPKHTEDWIRAMNSRGIDVKRPVFKPLHRYLKLSDAEFPETVQAVKQACSLPIYPSMSERDCEEVCHAVRAQAFRDSGKAVVVAAY